MTPRPFLPVVVARRLARWAYRLGWRLADRQTSRRNSGGKLTTGESESAS